MDEKPNDSWIIPSECQLICLKYAWANTARWIMFVWTHDTEKPRACVNRLARKCTPSWIKGIILGQGRSVQVKSWTSLEASQDQRCTFVWLLCIFMKETHVWQEHEQNNSNTLCTLGFGACLSFSAECFVLFCRLTAISTLNLLERAWTLAAQTVNH